MDHLRDLERNQGWLADPYNIGRLQRRQSASARRIIRTRQRYNRRFTYANQQQLDYANRASQQNINLRATRSGAPNLNAQRLRSLFQSRREHRRGHLALPRARYQRRADRFVRPRRPVFGAGVGAPRPRPKFRQIGGPSFSQRRRVANLSGPPSQARPARKSSGFSTSDGIALAAAGEILRFGYKGLGWSYRAFRDKYRGKTVKAPSWTAFF